MKREPIAVVNPRTGVADAVIVPLSATEVADVAGRLRAAQPAWAGLGVEGRLSALTALSVAIAAHGETIAAALEQDTGRRRVSALEVESVIGLIGRWVRQAAGIIAGAQAVGETAMQTVSYRLTLEPMPLVGVISPWNFPLLLALTDAIPALAAGCAVMVKPSEVTPRFITPLRAAISEVPEVSQVLAILEGDGETGSALVDAVDFVSFTGSVATGRKVGEAAARAFIPTSLELGGKDPMIVMASADPVRAAEIALSASCRATGQACQSIERIYVAAGIFDAFRDALVEKARAVRPNHPDIRFGDIGPFIFGRQADIVQAQIDDAVAKGATVLSGGKVLDLDGGKWLLPTVLTGVNHDMPLMQEETFGPVLPLISFGTEDEAVALANDSSFGLSASVIAGSLEEAEAVAVRLKAGAVSLNDGALTGLLSDAEKSSFGLSGLGPSRMGASGLLRFFRKRALLLQHGSTLPLAAFSEGGR